MSKLILAIESSCDETAASVMRFDEESSVFEYEFLSSVIDSQIDLHAAYGGVFPDLAARVHVQKIRPIVDEAVRKSGVTLSEVDYIAVTSGPGLIASLLVGVEFAKGLALGTGKPLLKINHMDGHLYSFWESGETPAFPAVSLVVSGGHTLLILLEEFGKYRVLGSTLDDAAGEAFDKTARMLGLPYPGGPALSKLAQTSTGLVPEFPRPMLKNDNFSFSFSGLKTSVLYHLKKRAELSETEKADVAKGVEDAIVSVLTAKTVKAALECNARTITLSGGVAANSMLRETLAKKCQELGLTLLIAPRGLCTDNAQMIALAAGLQVYHKQINPSPLGEVRADAGWEI